MITKKDGLFVDERTQETMKMVAFLYDPKTMKVLSYGANSTCKLMQKSRFVSEQRFYPIIQIGYGLKEDALDAIIRHRSLDGFLTERGNLKMEFYLL